MTGKRSRVHDIFVGFHVCRRSLCFFPTFWYIDNVGGAEVYMADGLAMELRIYCICGQKMKVSESMFGLPGKCVACRQKIRVPTREEVPPDTSVIYLKDHPEFLRKAKPVLPQLPAAGADVKPSAEEQGVITLGEPDEAVSVTILDILEPLRVLCSLEHKIQRQLDAGGDTLRQGVPALTGRSSFLALRGQ
jgi:hypothetical protein